VHPHLLDGAPIPDTIEAMAADRLRALRALRAHGPYCLAGYCNGALVAFEMARQLVATGDEVPMVVAIQARAPRGAAAAPATADGQYVVFDGAGVRVLVPHDRESDLLLRYSQAIDAYRGGNYAGRLVLIRAHAPAAGPRDFGWSRFAPRIEVHVLPGDHVTLVTRHVGALAQVIRGAMASIGAPAGA
jgi:thioesterase domain-containing protein